MLNAPIQVAIADDHPVVRLGVRTILESNPQIEVCTEYANAAKVMSEYMSAEWEVLVLDIDLKDGNGVEMTKQMLAVRPELKILILSIYPESKYALRAMKAGAKGYLNKDFVLTALEDAILKIGQGKLYVSDELSQQLATQALQGGTSEERHESLSDRELQILCLYGAGKSNQEMAEELFLSVKTVSTYRSRILEKMKMSTTAELISYAISNGLVV